MTEIVKYNVAIDSIVAEGEILSEFEKIRRVDMMSFIKFVEQNHLELEEIRLPLNNRKALEYLKWASMHFNGDSTYLNYIINMWEPLMGEERVRPPTMRELAVYMAR